MERMGKTIEISVYDLQELRNENKRLEEENKNLRDYADNLDSENDNQAIEIEELKKENKKLKKYYDRDKEELMESCYGLARENDELKKENENLRAELGEYKKMFENQLKDGYIKNTAEFLDKKFPKVNGFMEEDTLQELRDIGKIE